LASAVAALQVDAETSTELEERLQSLSQAKAGKRKWIDGPGADAVTNDGDEEPCGVGTAPRPSLSMLEDESQATVWYWYCGRYPVGENKIGLAHGSKMVQSARTVRDGGEGHRVLVTRRAKVTRRRFAY
jgi:hypothetical protein